VKKFFRLLGAGLKWSLLALIGVEIFCFLLITVSNLLLFGSPWEGSRASYDAFAIFLNVEGVQPTRHNPPESDPHTAEKSPRPRTWSFFTTAPMTAPISISTAPPRPIMAIAACGV
jgi:hypothetical protein